MVGSSPLDPYDLWSTTTAQTSRLDERARSAGKREQALSLAHDMQAIKAIILNFVRVSSFNAHLRMALPCRFEVPVLRSDSHHEPLGHNSRPCATPTHRHGQSARRADSVQPRQGEAPGDWMMGRGCFPLVRLMRVLPCLSLGWQHERAECVARPPLSLTVPRFDGLRGPFQGSPSARKAIGRVALHEGDLSLSVPVGCERRTFQELEVRLATAEQELSLALPLERAAAQSRGMATDSDCTLPRRAR